ncbi:MAG: DUF6064 family protein [Tannerellaceae bacterium]|jgi:hypothetical protein|nr:DUF6064 family protein [Tannerellaceae bacterium]
MHTFWKTIGLYNSATWLGQLLIVVTGIILTTLLIRKQSPTVKRLMKIYLTGVYLWIAIVYYLIYCAERNYNALMALFWGVMAIAWIWDTVTGYTTFEYNKKYRVFACFLLLSPFMYPLFSLLRGLSYPEITSPVMPCSVVTFTLGLLLLYSRKVNIFMVLLLCHWSLIGLAKTYFFQIPEDFILVSVSIPALYLFFNESFIRNLPKDAKPKAKYIHGLLILICVMLGAVLVSSLLQTAFAYP